METVIKDRKALMNMEEDHNTGDGDTTTDSDATVALPDDTSIDEDQILIEWIYMEWKSFFSSVEGLLDKFPNETERIHEENPILKSEKAQRLNAILCKTLKSEIRGTLKSSYDFQVFWETAITSVTQEEDERRRKMNGGWNEEDS
jgi:hypothetical protein